MDKNEILEYLTMQIDLLQRKAVELSDQRDEIDRQLENYKELMRYYRGVIEAEEGVGVHNRVSTVNRDDFIAEIIPGVSRESEIKSIPERITPGRRNIRWAILQIVKAADVPLKTKQVCHLLAEKYPDIANKSKNLLQTVETSLWKGWKQNLYKKTGKGLYRLK